MSDFPSSTWDEHQLYVSLVWILLSDTENQYLSISTESYSNSETAMLSSLLVATDRNNYMFVLCSYCHLFVKLAYWSNSFKSVRIWLRSRQLTECQILNVLHNPSQTQSLLGSQGQWRATDASLGTPWRAPNKRHALKMARGFLQHQFLVWKIIEIEVSTLKYLFFHRISFNFGVVMNLSRLPYCSMKAAMKSNTSTAVKWVESM